MFGQNPYDKLPTVSKRYHVVDPEGFIVAKYDYGFTAFNDCGRRSGELPGTPGKFSAIDTRDGSMYGAYENGKVVE